MKKITSFICFIVLTALLAMSIPFITANAEETDPSKPDLQADDIEIMRGFESICGNEVESLIGEIKKDYLESFFDNYYKEHDTQTKEQWLNDHHASIKELYLLSDYVIAVYILWGWEGIAELEYDETVAGYTFHFHNMKSYLIWNDHKFLTLSEAYEQGIISESSVGELYEYSPHKSVQQSTDPSTTGTQTTTEAQSSPVITQPTTTPKTGDNNKVYFIIALSVVLLASILLLKKKKGV